MRWTRTERLGDLLGGFLETGEDSAMAELVLRTRPRLLAVARRIGDPQDAEDSVQSAYHSLLRCARGVGRDSVLGWLITATVRITFRRKAVQARQQALAERLARPLDAKGPALTAEEQERAALIRRAVNRLPAKYRDVLVLHHLLDLSVEETARMLDAPVSTVTTRLSRGRRLLRAKLSPSLMAVLLILPWLLVDSAKAAAAPVALGLEAVMKVKTAALIVAGALAVGAVGFGLATQLGDGGGVPPEAAPSGDEARLSVELARARREAAVLRGELEATRDGLAGAAGPGDPRPGGQPAPSGTPRPDRDGPVPEGAREPAAGAGTVLSATDAAAFADRFGDARAHGRPGDIERGEAAMAALASHGEDGYRALAELLRGGRNGTWFPGLFEKAWAPGRERILIAVAADPAVHLYSRSTALASLGTANTPATREYLLATLEKELEPLLFMAAAQALGRLGESAGTRFVDDRIFGPGWGGVRPGVIAALGSMGGSDAVRILTDLARDPRIQARKDPGAYQDLTATLAALRKLDAAAAVREADAILRGGADDELRAALAPFVR